jgi:hypothetical protein
MWRPARHEHRGKVELGVVARWRGLAVCGLAWCKVTAVDDRADAARLDKGSSMARHGCDGRAEWSTTWRGTDVQGVVVALGGVDRVREEWRRGECGVDGTVASGLAWCSWTGALSEVDGLLGVGAWLPGASAWWG